MVNAETMTVSEGYTLRRNREITDTPVSIIQKRGRLALAHAYGTGAFLPRISTYRPSDFAADVFALDWYTISPDMDIMSALKLPLTNTNLDLSQIDFAKLPVDLLPYWKGHLAMRVSAIRVSRLRCTLSELMPFIQASFVLERLEVITDADDAEIFFCNDPTVTRILSCDELIRMHVIRSKPEEPFDEGLLTAKHVALPEFFLKHILKYAPKDLQTLDLLPDRYAKKTRVSTCDLWTIGEEYLQLKELCFPDPGRNVRNSLAPSTHTVTIYMPVMGRPPNDTWLNSRYDFNYVRKMIVKCDGPPRELYCISGNTPALKELVLDGMPYAGKYVSELEPDIIDYRGPVWRFRTTDWDFQLARTFKITGTRISQDELHSLNRLKKLETIVLTDCVIYNFDPDVQYSETRYKFINCTFEQ
jgi:hypothetical protein